MTTVDPEGPIWQYVAEFMTRVLIAFSICAFISGCSGQPSAPPSGAQPAASTAATSAGAPAAASEPTSAEEQAADASAIQALQKWTGDLDGMIERRLIRVLT